MTPDLRAAAARAKETLSVVTGDPEWSDRLDPARIESAIRESRDDKDDAEDSPFLPPRAGDKQAGDPRNTTRRAPEARDARAERPQPEPRSKARQEPQSLPSLLESVYRERYQAPAAAQLELFGHAFLEGHSTGRAGTERSVRRPLPGPDYMIGPDDTLKIRVWSGELDLDVRALVQSDGAADIPRLGRLEAAGLTLAAFETLVLEEARKYAQNAKVKVSALQLRDAEVWVTGEVAKPGLLVLPQPATIVSALSRAGGVTRTGSLRRVQAQRGGRALAEVDLYDLLIAGKPGSPALTMQLKDGDVIFVPRLGPTAAVAGAVARPGVYELSRERVADDAVRLAGGELPQGRRGQTILRRFEGGRLRVKELDSRLHETRKEALKEGDLIEVVFTPANQETAVALEGHVWSPRLLEWRAGLTLRDLLPSPRVLKPEALTSQGVIHRLDPATGRRVPLAFPLQEVLDGRHDQPLAPGDVVRALSREEYGIFEPVTVAGAVWREGEQPHAPGLTVAAALAIAGGTRTGADLSGVELVRPARPDGEQNAPVRRNLNLATEGETPLEPGDWLRVPFDKERIKGRFARIDGEVRRPGSYRLTPGERYSSLIRRAGGYTPQAYLRGARLTSEKARAIQQANLDKMLDELQVRVARIFSDETFLAATGADGVRQAKASLENLVGNLRNAKAEGRVIVKLDEPDRLESAEADLPVEDGDALTIPARPGYVSVVGAAYAPGAYPHSAAATVQDYLNRAGGMTPEADNDRWYVLKVDGEVLSPRQSGMFTRLKARTLEPGDVIVVPQDIALIPWFKFAFIREIADTVFKIAIAAGIATIVF